MNHTERWSQIEKWGRRLFPWLAVAIFSLAVLVGRRLLRDHSLAEIMADMAQMPSRQLAWAGLATVTAYGLLSGYDWLAIFYLQHRLAYRKVLLASFMAFAFGTNIGMGNVAGTSIRLRVYSALGVAARDIVLIIFFCSLTLWLGFSALAGAVLIVHPPILPESIGVGVLWLRLCGALFIAVVLIYWFLAWRGVKLPRVARFKVSLPHLQVAVAQVVVGALQWTMAAFVLHCLLPAPPAFATFLPLYVSAQVVSLLSHVPGGVGVLEGMVLFLLQPDKAQTTQVIAALLIYRLLYYGLPLLIAAIMLALFEWRQWRRRH